MRPASGRSWLRIAAHPPFAFLRNYILRYGIRQGVPGLVVSLLNSYYVLLKFAKLWELQRRAEDTALESADRAEVTGGTAALRHCGTAEH